MENQIKKALENHLNTLKEFQSHLFDQGHTFWHCNMADTKNIERKPFYYYQINRTTHMSTCSTCYQLIENRKKIRALQKLLGIDLTPLTSNVTTVEELELL